MLGVKKEKTASVCATVRETKPGVGFCGDQKEGEGKVMHWGIGGGENLLGSKKK